MTNPMQAISSKKGSVEYPPDHKVGMRVTQGGSMCKNCGYVRNQNCSNKYFQRWLGSNVIPAPIDSYCCDFWEPSKNT